MDLTERGYRTLMSDAARILIDGMRHFGIEVRVTTLGSGTRIASPWQTNGGPALTRNALQIWGEHAKEIASILDADARAIAAEHGIDPSDVDMSSGRFVPPVRRAGGRS